MVAAPDGGSGPGATGGNRPALSALQPSAPHGIAAPRQSRTVCRDRTGRTRPEVRPAIGNLAPAPGAGPPGRPAGRTAGPVRSPAAGGPAEPVRTWRPVGPLPSAHRREDPLAR